MYLSMRHFSSLLASLLIIFLAVPAFAEEASDADSTESSPPAATETTEDNAAVADTAEVSESKTFPLPDDLESPEEYLELVSTIASENIPEEQTEEAMDAFKLKLSHTVLSLTDKALALEPEEETELQSYYFRMQALKMLDDMGESGNSKQIDKLVEKLRADKRTDFQSLGMKFYVEDGLGRWQELSQGKKQEMFSALVNFLEQGEMDASKLSTISTVSSMWQYHGDAEMASSLVEAMLPKLENSGNPMLVRQAEVMRGELRLLKLPGNELKLTGTLLDGTEFDWDSYRGKVVLVDFWATWCPPCRAEFPNMKKQYELYKDKGFEIIGISLDDNREQLKEFVEANELPWTIMFNKDEENPENDHPNARYYGISGIPQTILVDAQGKVVSLNALGDELPKLLKKLLDEKGDPLADKPEPNADPS